MICIIVIYFLSLREMMALHAPHTERLNVPEEVDDDFSESFMEEEYYKFLGNVILLA